MMNTTFFNQSIYISSFIVYQRYTNTSIDYFWWIWIHHIALQFSIFLSHHGMMNECMAKKFSGHLLSIFKMSVTCFYKRNLFLNLDMRYNPAKMFKSWKIIALPLLNTAKVIIWMTWNCLNIYHKHTLSSITFAIMSISFGLEYFPQSFCTALFLPWIETI